MATSAQKRVSILSIGTELTQGQIVNRNAAWISERLAKMGIRTTGHWTVPDDRPLIREAMRLAQKTSDLIFVTGGLGPTSDDFTREMISEVVGRPLVWHEPSWLQIQERLASRGVQATEIQKQQCYYPEGAWVLGNSQGTANGFGAQTPSHTWITLPGPPREIAAIWQEHLQAWLPSQFPGLDPWVTRIWETLGQGESTIAQLAEEALQGADFEKGYRVHVPFVEVKMSFAKSREPEAAPWIEKVTKALAAYTVLRDGQESPPLLMRALRKFPRLRIEDAVSGEYLWSRLSGSATASWRDQRMLWSNRIDSTPSPDLVLSLEFCGNRQARARLRHGALKRSEILSSPFTSLLMHERERQVFAELAIFFWIRELANLG